MDKNNILWLVVKDMMEYIQTTEKNSERAQKMAMWMYIMQIIDKQKEGEAIELQQFELLALENLRLRQERR